LSDLGRDQTLAAARNLEAPAFDLAISSDLGRAQETASLLLQHCGLDVPLLIEPLLKEFDVGEWSGLTRDEIEDRWPDQLSRFDEGQLDGPPGGETRRAFDDRVIKAAEAVARLVTARKAERVLVIAHGGVIRCLGRVGRMGEHRVTHLAGYRGRTSVESLSPIEYVDLLNG
jgi:broad specificity phosphatase PhoE